MARLWELFGRTLGGPVARVTVPLRAGDVGVLTVGGASDRRPVTVDAVVGDEILVRTPSGAQPCSTWPSTARLEATSRGGPVTAWGEVVAVRDVPGDTVLTVRVERVEQHERRAGVRIPVSVPIRVTSGRRWHEGWTFDVGVGGVRFVLIGDAAVRAGEHLEVALTLPPHGAVTSTVEVLRATLRPASPQRPPQLVVGAAFRGDGPDRDAALAAFVAAQSS